MSPKKVRACVLYARISLRTEESVSIARQIESGTKHAEALGWKVVGTFIDEGVSATHNRPEARKGWQDLLASNLNFQAVVIWKVDRLARRVQDFVNADAALQERGAALVTVQDSIDMTTAAGRFVAQMLAAFGEMEAATMRDRQTAARDYLLRAGRSPGGAALYGYRQVPNPTGAGYILAQHEEQIGYVREMVRRTLSGLSVYSTKQWLDEVGAPPPLLERAEAALAEARAAAEHAPADADAQEKLAKAEQQLARVKEVGWRYSAVDRTLRHPLLAGMTPHNPGNTTSHVRGDEVLRDGNGLPVVDETLAIMPVAQWRAMQERLAAPTSPQKTPRAMRRKHSGLLSGLMWCAEHPEPVRMWRGALGTKERPRPAYICRECKQSFSWADEMVVEEFLRELGDTPHFNMVEEVVEGGSIQMQEATIRLEELGREAATATGARRAEIQAEQVRLWEIQDEARDLPPQVRLVPVGGEPRTFAEDWDAAANDEERRTILGHGLGRVLVKRGVRGEKTEAGRRARLSFEWAMLGGLTDEELAALGG